MPRLMQASSDAKHQGMDRKTLAPLAPWADPNCTKCGKEIR
jgi:hypothetical protein